MSLKSFVIHLERAADRKVNVDRLLAQLPDARIAPAVDGQLLEPEDVGRFYPNQPLYMPAYPFELSRGELGCFLSHRAVWQTMISENLGEAIIVEDDVELQTEEFAKALSVAKSHIGHSGYVQFQTREVVTQTHLVATGEAQLVRPMLVPLRTSAQLVSRGAAEQLLRLSETVDRPIDTWMQMYWETKIDVSCATPSGVRDLTRQSGGSTISSKRSVGQKLVAEVKRALYRHKIAKLSKKNWPY